MKLEINGEEVLFELENEKNLLDFVNSITRNLSSSGFMSFKFDIDGQEICLQDSQWDQQRLLSDIECIKVDGERVYDFEACLSILDFTKKVFNRVEVDYIRREELFSLWPFFILSLKFWLLDFHLGENYFSEMSNVSDLFERSINNSSLKEKVLRFLNLSEVSMQEKGRELENPQEEILLLMSRLQKFKSSLKDFSILFQNGNEAKAMQDLVIFMELFYKLIRTLNFLPQSYSDFCERITQITKSLSAEIKNFTKACEVKDYVLAGDLAEYEIIPQLEKLDGFKNLLEYGI